MEIAALIILLDYLRKTFMAIMSDEHDNNKMRVSNSKHKNSMPYMEATL
jgi:hypothetical protein